MKLIPKPYGHFSPLSMRITKWSFEIFPIRNVVQITFPTTLSKGRKLKGLFKCFL